MAHKMMHKNGDDPHKLQIVAGAAPNRAFGITKGVGVRSHVQLLHLLGHVTAKFGNGVLILMQTWLGSAKKPKKFPVVNEQRWGLVGEACIEFLKRKSWTDAAGGNRCFPCTRRDLAKGSKGLARTVLVEIAVTCEGMSSKPLSFLLSIASPPQTPPSPPSPPPPQTITAFTITSHHRHLHHCHDPPSPPSP
jgi:hypothetical protein